jgi:hypothetical protein
MTRSAPVIVFGEDVFYLLPAEGAFVKDIVAEIAFAAAGLKREGFHWAFAGALAVARNLSVDMK